MGATVKILLGITGILLVLLVLCVYFIPSQYQSRGTVKYVPYRYGAPGPQK